MDKIIEDDEPLYEFELEVLDGHANKTRVLAELSACAEKIDDLLQGDLTMLSSVFAGAGFAFWKLRVEQKPDVEVPEMVRGAALIEGHNEFQRSLDAVAARAREVENLSSSRKPTGWQVNNEFRQTAEAQKLNSLQYSDEIEPGPVTAEMMERDLNEITDILPEVEPLFLKFVQDAELPLIPCKEEWERGISIAEMREKGRHVVFGDQHLYSGFLWRQKIKIILRHHILRFNVEALRGMVKLRDRSTELFAQFYPDDLETLPDRVHRLKEELEAEIATGLTIPRARQLGETYGLGRHEIVMKTWLDRRCDSDEISKGKKDGKVAYWPARQDRS